MNKLKQLLKTKKPVVIGMVHCCPLLGYKDFPGFKVVENKFMSDLQSLLDGGIDAVLIENNYDIPHYEKAKRSTIPQLTDLCVKARKITNKPLGVIVLWNDYETALSIAKFADLDFVRVPVFVDKVETDYGIFEPKSKQCLEFRNNIKANEIMILADIQVKHAKHLIERSLNDAIIDAIGNQADGIIITGKWTGDPPTIDDANNAKKTSKEVPVFLGSGMNFNNIKNYNVDGMIVGTYFKGQSPDKKKDYQNIFPWEAKIQKDRVSRFMNNL